MHLACNRDGGKHPAHIALDGDAPLNALYDLSYLLGGLRGAGAWGKSVFVPSAQIGKVGQYCSALLRLALFLGTSESEKINQSDDIIKATRFDKEQYLEVTEESWRPGLRSHLLLNVALSFADS
ncbi:hypothetical protein [Bradyrhizobium diazoefficiens]|uniref:hypothetical protein n=1 Tax=Bradyrhizobium diazoefficiens TaxID=1355477 RepID=UPI003838E917